MCPAGPLGAVLGVLLSCLFFAQPALGKPFLCDDPWTYRIGKVDERFNLGPSEVRDVVQQACAVWRKAYSCDLFREDPKGVITINFIYDERQDKVDKFRALNTSLESSKKARSNLAAILVTQKSELEKKKRALADEWKGYENRYNILDVRVRFMKMQGKVSEKDRQYLATEPPAMRALYKELESRGQDLKDEEKKLQSLEDAIRKMDDDVKKHSDMGKSFDEPVKAGVFARLNQYRVINIYLCLNEKRLVRMLAHEFGHALGLGHSNDPNSLMYWLDESDSLEITYDDREALKKAFKGFD